jgi:hypothetical protein
VMINEPITATVPMPAAPRIICERLLDYLFVM